jgi:hypothetical protein
LGDRVVVLPAFSLPCMMMLGGSLQRFRQVAWWSVAVMVVGPTSRGGEKASRFASRDRQAGKTSLRLAALSRLRRSGLL